MPDWIYENAVVLYKGAVKRVRSWYFTSDGTHNGDIIILKFADGTKCEGLRDVEQGTEDAQYVAEMRTISNNAKAALRKKKREEKIRKEFAEFKNGLYADAIQFDDLARMYFELKNKVKVEGV